MSCCWFFNASILPLFCGSNRRRLELASVPCGGTVDRSIFQGVAVQVDVGRIRTVKRHPHSRDTPRGGLWIICQNQNQNQNDKRTNRLYWGLSCVQRTVTWRGIGLLFATSVQNCIATAQYWYVYTDLSLFSKAQQQYTSRWASVKPDKVYVTLGAFGIVSVSF